MPTMTRKSPRRRRLRLKTRTPQLGVRTLMPTMTRKSLRREASSQDKNSSIGSRTLRPTMTRKSPRKEEVFVSQEELLNRE
jgi:hypothetical protein